MMCEEIFHEVSTAKYFSLLCDETRDTSKVEQMSLILRYLRPFSQSLEIVESFVGFFPCDGLDAVSLRDTILKVLTDLNIDFKDGVIGQCYDGGSVISGSSGGVQKLMRELVPCAFYVHCHAHRINLVVVDVCKGNAKISDIYLHTEEPLQILFHVIPHSSFINAQKEHYPYRQPLELPSISDTRWVCQHRICKTVCMTLPAIIESLDDPSFGECDERAAIT